MRRIGAAWRAPPPPLGWELVLLGAIDEEPPEARGAAAAPPGAGAGPAEGHGCGQLGLSPGSYSPNHTGLVIAQGMPPQAGLRLWLPVARAKT